MKKLIGLSVVLILMLSAISFADGTTPAKTGDSGKLGVGFYGGTPTLRYNFSNDARGQLGVGFASAAGTSVFTLLLAGDVDVTKISGNEVNIGGIFNLTSATGGSTWTAAFTCGVDTKINQSLVLELKVWPVSVTSLANTTTFSIFNTATIGAHLYL